MITDAIKDNGSKNADGKSSVAYGVLFDKTANTRTFIILITKIWYEDRILTE